MATYSKELKESLITKMLAQDISAAELARETGISINTLYRWRDRAKKQGGLSVSSKTADKLSREEKKSILDVMHSKEYAELPPSQVVPRLADQGIYIASESSFYRVLREAGEIQAQGIYKTASKKRNFNPCSNRSESGVDVGY